MSPTPENFTHLVKQVQIAHRLCVGFYQRLLPTIQRMANELDCNFRSWSPIETSRPASPSTQPGGKWAWDMVPMFATKHEYQKVGGNTARKGDLMLSFVIYFDENFSKERRDAARVKGQPDPLTMPESGEATVRIRLQRCTADSNTTFDSLLEAVAEPQTESTGWQPLSEKVEMVALRYMLADFVANEAQVTDSLKVLLGPVETS